MMVRGVRNGSGGKFHIDRIDDVFMAFHKFSMWTSSSWGWCFTQFEKFDNQRNGTSTGNGSYRISFKRLLKSNSPIETCAMLPIRWSKTWMGKFMMISSLERFSSRSIWANLHFRCSIDWHSNAIKNSWMNRTRLEVMECVEFFCLVVGKDWSSSWKTVNLNQSKGLKVHVRLLASDTRMWIMKWLKINLSLKPLILRSLCSMGTVSVDITSAINIFMMLSNSQQLQMQFVPIFLRSS